jgi:hypothetical protein
VWNEGGLKLRARSVEFISHEPRGDEKRTEYSVKQFMGLPRLELGKGVKKLKSSRDTSLEVETLEILSIVVKNIDDGGLECNVRGLY